MNEAGAATLTSHGYTASAIAYSSVEGLPTASADIPTEYFEMTLHWMQNWERIERDRFAVIG